MVRPPIWMLHYWRVPNTQIGSLTLARYLTTTTGANCCQLALAHVVNLWYLFPVGTLVEGSAEDFANLSKPNKIRWACFTTVGSEGEILTVAREQSWALYENYAQKFALILQPHVSLYFYTFICNHIHRYEIHFLNIYEIMKNVLHFN